MNREDTALTYRLCRCGCPSAAHEHYRRGTDCSGCPTCRRFRPAVGRLRRLRRFLRHRPAAGRPTTRDAAAIVDRALSAPPSETTGPIVVRPYMGRHRLNTPTAPPGLPAYTHYLH